MIFAIVLACTASLYFADATLASAFVARWCVGSKVETTGGVFQVREDEPAPRVGAGLQHRDVRLAKRTDDTISTAISTASRRADAWSGRPSVTSN